MKELSIEQKAKAYDEALKVLHKYDGANIMFTQDLKEEMFPELKESEDERIRKRIYDYINVTLDDNESTEKEKWLAWIEKQGEQATLQTNERAWLYLVSDVLTWKDGIGQYLDDPRVQELAKRLCSEYTQKLYSPSVLSNSSNIGKNKIEPRFKVGDWIITSENKVLQITSIEDTRYSFNNESRYWEIYYCDKECRLWTIQDAKDGDVLYAKGTKDSYFREYIFNFSSFTEDNVISTNFGYDVFHGTFDTKLSRFGREEDFVSVTPASKEQRDLLFTKMKEVGYEWANKKEE